MKGFGIDIGNSALIVIDMQNDFVHPDGAFPVKGINSALDKMKSLIGLFRKRELPIVFTRHVSDPVKNPVELLMYPEMAKRGLKKGTWGFEIFAEIQPSREERVMDKYRYDAFLGTDLEGYLRQKGARDLVITGCQTHICVDTTARSASCRDFRVTIVEDLCFSRNPRFHECVLAIFRRSFGQVTDHDSLMEIMRAGLH